MQREPTAEGEPAHSCGHSPGCDHHTMPAQAKGGAAPLGASSLWIQLKSWLLWFLAFFGIYASSSVCVFCGTPGCPVGPGGAALVGGVFSVVWRYGQAVAGRLTAFFRRVVSREVPRAAGRDQEV